MKLRNILILAGSVAAASQACALSLGNSQGQVQLGAPLNLVFQVQPDDGQTAESSCITATVWMGDDSLSPGNVLITPQATTVRVRTTQVVHEPLVTVKLTAGCAGSVARSYTLFADPPSSMAATIAPIDLSKLQVTPRPAARPAPAADAPARPVRKVTKRVVKPAAAAPVAAAAVAAPAAASANSTVAPPPAPPAVTAPAPSAAEPAATTQPRLRMEPLEGLGSPQTAPEAPASAETTEPRIDAQTQALLDTNAQRLQTLEQQLLGLQSQLKNNQTELLKLNTQLAQAEQQGLPAWVHILLGLLALSLACIAWLLQRIKQERQNSQHAWAETVLAAAHPTAEPTEAALQAALTPATAPAPVPPLVQAAAQQPEATETIIAATAPAMATPAVVAVPQEPPLPEPAQLQELPSQVAETAPARAPVAPPDTSLVEMLTAQALFDVQEQAEFYASIGENDQAVDILQSHIAQHQASSPLAYLELLQLLYRLSRTDAYEQAREQFQAHFNVQVPSFLGFSRKGRDLWSGYPEVLGKIEALWPTDDVQSLLRSLIVNNPATALADTEVRFDLAAFDDLLMLYNVAQTTPASSRGQMPGRIRTAPTEVPLPEVVFDAPAAVQVAAPASFLPDDAFLSLRTTPAPRAPVAPPEVTLPLQAAQLDMLTAAPAQSPLAATDLPGDSPFQSPSHFSPDEVLMQELSLDWNSTSPAASAPADFTTLDLQTLTMDERDLPPSPPAAPPPAH
ncbi:type IV pilus assembly protein FimV [Comamonas aquatica]|uniref:type IV pilus assembly protein FimV n=1 Tax=Comamonas aquatica TaxID=225991 RepID=UPI0005A61B34|nr:hypothetical protein [Comamonas aquatica]